MSLKAFKMMRAKSEAQLGWQSCSSSVHWRYFELEWIDCEQGGMSNEIYNVLARVTDGLYEGIAIGGDVYPGSTLSDHVLRFNNIPQVWTAGLEV